MMTKSDTDFFKFADHDFTGIIEFRDGYFYKHGIGKLLYYKNGMYHREDGPALVYCSSLKSKAWFLNDLEYSMEKWKIEVERLKKSRLLLK
jgi:2-oxoglutarate dehydrogenase complex dehydrogenase (E1) component-like enzyme